MNEELRNETMDTIDDTWEEANDIEIIVESESTESEAGEGNSLCKLGVTLGVTGIALGVGIATKALLDHRAKKKGTAQHKTKLGRRFSAAKEAFRNPDVIDADYEEVDVVEDSEK